MLNAQQWSQLKDVFAEATTRDPAERAQYLIDLARTDAELSRELELLLAADEQANARLEHLDLITSPASPADSQTEAVPRDPFGLAGQTVSHFRVLDVLGAGGMGVAYRAEDVRLGRKVALKFLLPQYSLDVTAKERFLHEARAASALDHPNVCTVYEVGRSEHGQLFLAMPVYAGETLKERLERAGPLGVEDAVSIARQTLLGLGAAHDAGITHRDLKPANLMITPDGTVKILDFGLARMKDLHLTHPGLRLGTVAYMSPEQLDARPLDQRTDLWSLGVVLYEMLTGTRPFGGGHDLSTVYSILHEQPAPLSSLRPEVPAGIAAITAKLLSKDASARYPAAADVVAELDGSAPPTPARVRMLVAGRPHVWPVLMLLLIVVAAAFAAFQVMKGSDGGATAVASAPESGSIAVLPFLDVSPGQNQEYFADGITEEILNALAQLPELRVIARTSSFSFKGKDVSAREIGRQLNVRALLEGSAHRSDDRVHITTRLIDARTEAHIWSHTFASSLGDVYAVQTEIAAAVAEELRVRLVPGPVPGAPPTRSAEAHERYLLGLFRWNRRTVQDLLQAITFFEDAIRLDSTYAQPWAGLALAHAVLIPLPTYASPPGSLARVEAAAARALQLNPYLAEAHAALGYAYHWHWRWDDAERELNSALALNPRYATAHQWYGEHLTMMGRSAEGIAHMQHAIALDPVSTVAHNDLGILMMLDHRYDEAMAQFERVLRMDPAFSISLFLLHRVHMLAGHPGAAADAGRRWAELTGMIDPGDLITLAHATADGADHTAALAVLDRWEHRDSPRWTDIAMYYALLGEHDRAIAALDIAIQQRAPLLTGLGAAPWFDPLRDDPRMAALIRAMRYPD